MKRFFYASAAVLMLAIAFHFGYSTATAQAPSNPIVAVSGPWVYTANGDAYLQTANGTWAPYGNVFGGPTPALHESWGQLKSRYHTAPGTTVTPGANDR